jgi:hypothetical protein
MSLEAEIALGKPDSAHGLMAASDALLDLFPEAENRLSECSLELV